MARHKDKTYPLLQSLAEVTSRDFRQKFVDGTADDLVLPDGSIIGLPLYIETPILVYNRDIFNSAGVASAPGIWEDIVKVAKLLTQKTPAGDIKVSGMALGTTRNVSHYFEILSSLLMQLGEKIVDRKNNTISLEENTKNALDFYSSFASPTRENYGWNVRFPDSVDAFAQEKAAMAIVFHKDLARIAEKNPHLRFDSLPFPQFQNIRSPVVYGEFSFPTVSKFSRDPETAWRFLVFAAMEDGAEIYAKATKRPPARRDLLAKGPPTDDLYPSYRQALIARTWPVPDENSALRIFGEAVEGIISRTLSPEQAAGQLRDQLGALMYDRP